MQDRVAVDYDDRDRRVASSVQGKFEPSVACQVGGQSVAQRSAEVHRQIMARRDSSVGVVADVTDALYRQFDPLRPLAADKTRLYVDWQRQVGIEDVKDTLVNAFVRSGDQNIWRLFTGNRGVGKTTELLRVGQRLAEGVRGRRFFVSMLRSEQWLDLDDMRAEDVAFQMVRQLVSDLVERGDMNFKAEEVKGWGARILEWVKQTGVEVGPDWLKFSFTLKDFPGRRDEFRDLLRGQLPSLFDNVNQRLLTPAREHLARRGIEGAIVAIADDLDKSPNDFSATTSGRPTMSNCSCMKAACSGHCNATCSIPCRSNWHTATHRTNW